MIKVKVDGEMYSITRYLKVSEGKHKEFREKYIESVRLMHHPHYGFFEPFLYACLADVKHVELVSCSFVPPSDDKDMVY